MSLCVRELNTVLLGVDQGHFIHYRGVPYATIPARFHDPVLNRSPPPRLDCTRFGPRCPQIRVDVGYLLREPEGGIFYTDEEDELTCTNLDIAVPKQHAGDGDGKLPVLFWVHGGSQVVSYGNGGSKIGDVTKLVDQSVQSRKPMIVVNVQYRLGIFHVGDSETRKNLGLRDLLCALEWVERYIGAFGGDSDQIALAGESAGAALAHAMVVTGARVKRVALMSGSLWMSGPRPDAMGESAVREPVRQRMGGKSLEEASARELVQAQQEAGIVSVFLQAEENLENWQTATGQVEELVVGDCEYESVLWRNGIEAMSVGDVHAAFDKGGPSAADLLRKLYHINRARPSSCRSGALDFVNDMVWAMPTWKMAELFRGQGKKVYTYLFDQANPWQASARAHHAVDLLYLFEGFDIASNPSGQQLARAQREKYIDWIHGHAPWSPTRTCAFGPHGRVQEIGQSEVQTRRRMYEMDQLKSMPFAGAIGVVGALVAGRISLHN